MKQITVENRLEEDHRSLGDLIAQLCAALDERDVERSFERLDAVWARLAVHIRAEHLCLFPAILDAASKASASEDGGAQLEDTRTTINQLRRDHDFFMTELARVVKAIREIRGSQNPLMSGEQLRQVQQAVVAIKARLEEHNRVEEEQVYRWPAAFLSSSGRSELGECVRHELDNMPPRFANLRAQDDVAR
ncbi:MAG: hemerythrin domain-containing protein [Acidobacteriota bacterium]|nr:hemerythrin domain-containing protein [Acidobacteriota bacterium]